MTGSPLFPSVKLFPGLQYSSEPETVYTMDVTFDGVTLSAISEPETTDIFPFNETELAAGDNYVEAMPKLKFSRTYLCGPADATEREAIRSKYGIPGDLVIAGVTYDSCYIKPPVSFRPLCPGKWQYKITFVQHTSVL